MRNEHLFHIQTQPTEDQWTGIGGCRALRVKVDLFAPEVFERPDLGTDEDVQFGRKEAQNVDKAPFDKRYLSLVLVKGMGIDDGRVNTPEIQQRVDIFGCTLRHDRDDVKLVLFIHDASDLCRESKRSAFDEPTGETDGPCIDAFFGGYVGLLRRGRGRRRLAPREGLSIGGQLEAEQG